MAGAPINPERTIESRRIYSGKILGLRIDTIDIGGGRTGTREIVEHGPAVVIVPVDAQDRVLLVRQYRKALERDLLELPAGGMNPDEDPDAAAVRELQEETGFYPGRLERLGGFYAAPGYCEEYLHLYLATDLEPRPLPQDEDEDVRLEPAPWDQIPGLLESGAICDAKSVAGLWWVLARRLRASR